MQFREIMLLKDTLRNMRREWDRRELERHWDDIKAQKRECVMKDLFARIDEEEDVVVLKIEGSEDKVIKVEGKLESETQEEVEDRNKRATVEKEKETYTRCLLIKIVELAKEMERREEVLVKCIDSMQSRVKELEKEADEVKKEKGEFRKGVEEWKRNILKTRESEWEVREEARRTERLKEEDAKRLEKDRWQARVKGLEQEVASWKRLAEQVGIVLAKKSENIVDDESSRKLLQGTEKRIKELMRKVMAEEQRAERVEEEREDLKMKLQITMEELTKASKEEAKALKRAATLSKTHAAERKKMEAEKAQRDEIDMLQEETIKSLNGKVRMLEKEIQGYKEIGLQDARKAFMEKIAEVEKLNRDIMEIARRHEFERTAMRRDIDALTKELESSTMKTGLLMVRGKKLADQLVVAKNAGWNAVVMMAASGTAPVCRSNLKCGEKGVLGEQELEGRETVGVETYRTLLRVARQCRHDADRAQYRVLRLHELLNEDVMWRTVTHIWGQYVMLLARILQANKGRFPNESSYMARVMGSGPRDDYEEWLEEVTDFLKMSGEYPVSKDTAAPKAFEVPVIGEDGKVRCGWVDLEAVERVVVRMRYIADRGERREAGNMVGAAHSNGEELTGGYAPRWPQGLAGGGPMKFKHRITVVPKSVLELWVSDGGKWAEEVATYLRWLDGIKKAGVDGEEGGIAGGDASRTVGFVPRGPMGPQGQGIEAWAEEMQRARELGARGVPLWGAW
ncbi:hypothetical protein BDZ91DRAFT_849306 [Kalaharituber pfeilii]|nr:hypothetical protein BDZ91DRAFT_849306 [Kalaharituber pfeilii]